MDLQDRKDELDNIVLRIDELLYKINDKNYIEQFELIKYEAMKELEPVESQLYDQYKKEELEANIEFEKSKV